VKAVSPDDPHYPITRLILVENTYGRKNGYPLPPEYFAEVYDIAQDHGLSVHMDGARLFNAAIALNVDVKTITESVDSVMFCLSKGLCAPVGSILCGSSPFIKRARRERKVLGGAMRQAGILAAAGLVALNEMIDRLATDHANASKLATGLARIPGIAVDPDLVRTNIVFFQLNDDIELTAEAVVRMMRDRANIWLDADDEKRMRIVTHYWVGEAEVKLLLDQLEEILADRRVS
jgi:threonine aldolase